jgi:D-alanyl-D-alanine carboxypeptidase (penicillin-binding protein 5/6)
LPTIGGEDLAGNGLSVPAGSPPLPANLAATSWLVADLDTGEVLGACGAHRFGPPASVQKLLLMETVLPKLNPTDVTTITAEDLNFEPGSSAVGLLLGGTYTVEELFLGLVLNSGNDAAQTLARLGGGSRGVAGTLTDMNSEAHRLGAWDTHAETPSGLDGPGQVTSAYDLAIIFRACFAHENFRRYIATTSARMPPEPPRDPDGYAIQNDNRLLYDYPGALGGKVGYTDLARHTYVGAAERNGRRLVATILGAEILPVRGWQQAAGLLDWGFASARGTSVGHLVAPGDAEKLMAPPQPSPTPDASTVAAVVGTTGGRTPPAAMLALVGAGAAVVGAWVLAMRVSRRRRATHRRWRAGDRDPALVGAGLAPPSPVEASATPEPPPASPLPAVDPNDPITDELPVVTDGSTPPSEPTPPAVFPPPPGPGSWEPPAVQR